MATWNTTITNKGTALQAKQVSGAKISFTKVVSGSGSVPVTNLKEQTAVSNIAQTLSMENVKLNGNQYTIKVFLTNNNLSTEYILSQIGFYATDPDEGEILFAIAQIDSDSAKIIPSRTDAPGYGIEFAFTFQNANNAEIEITPDLAGYMTREEVEQLVSDSVDAFIELGTDIEE